MDTNTRIRSPYSIAQETRELMREVRTSNIPRAEDPVEIAKSNFLNGLVEQALSLSPDTIDEMEPGVLKSLIQEPYKNTGQAAALGLGGMKNAIQKMHQA